MNWFETRLCPCRVSVSVVGKSPTSPLTYTFNLSGLGPVARKAQPFTFVASATVALSSLTSRAAAFSIASRNALRHSSGVYAGSGRLRRPAFRPNTTPAVKISTISGSATAHASLVRPSAFQLWVILACSAFISAKLLLCAIPRPPMYQSQCGVNRPARPSYERASLFNQYRTQEHWTLDCPVTRLYVQVK